MRFDQRARQALRDAGVSPDAIQRAEQDLADAASDTAADVEAFFDGVDTVFSDMDQTHASADYPEHDLDYVDLFTHSDDVRGFVRFDTWGAYVEDARVLSDELVELTLGPTVNDRVRFARERAHLE
ncbi:DUF7532 family protein [Halobacterium rubrum]|uniref:DUF7532 family protein n=1 Tax=Halobacterium TaxID=2239 RepID=UPI001F1F66AF|nr:MULTISPECIES: hypothetical protein [Halobacterium]MDH5020538.1 hypothetical protein [Halobacterium rubrum]